MSTTPRRNPSGWRSSAAAHDKRPRAGAPLTCLTTAWSGDGAGSGAGEGKTVVSRATCGDDNTGKDAGPGSGRLASQLYDAHSGMTCSSASDHPDGARPLGSPIAGGVGICVGVGVGASGGGS